LGGTTVQNRSKAGATVPIAPGWATNRESIRAVGGHHHGRRGVTDAKRSINPKALHQSTEHQAILLQRLNLHLPNSLEMA